MNSTGCAVALRALTAPGPPDAATCGLGKIGRLVRQQSLSCVNPRRARGGAR
jgi:hypothetical protein